MAGYDASVYQNNCIAHGHTIGTVADGFFTDPNTKISIEKREAICMKCGMGLDEIRKQSTAKRPRKVKAVSVPERT